MSFVGPVLETCCGDGPTRARSSAGKAVPQRAATVYFEMQPNTGLSFPGPVLMSLPKQLYVKIQLHSEAFRWTRSQEGSWERSRRHSLALF